MALRVRFQYATGAALSYSVERLADGAMYDFGSGAFTAAPAAPLAPLPEDSGLFAGRYEATLSPTPLSQWRDGDYAVTVHDAAADDLVVGELAAALFDGDDATVFPGGVPGGPPPGPAAAAAAPGDLLAAGAAWLAGRLQAVASEPVEYQRGAESVSLSATFGRTLLKLSDDFGAARYEWTDRDFLIPASALVIAGARTLPKRGDVVRHDDGVQVHTYEVLPYQDEPHWRWSDPFRTLIRLHTKRTRSDPP